MEAMFESPYYAVSHFEVEIGKDRIKHGIERNDAAAINVIADLPADAATRREGPDAFAYDVTLLRQVLI